MKASQRAGDRFDKESSGEGSSCTHGPSIGLRAHFLWLESPQCVPLFVHLSRSLPVRACAVESRASLLDSSAARWRTRCQGLEIRARARRRWRPPGELWPEGQAKKDRFGEGHCTLDGGAGRGAELGPGERRVGGERRLPRGNGGRLRRERARGTRR